ncbi:MAG: SMP-30/gluconolactonase/LRE family protein [Acidobacteria bacterium]|nr:SMP-30/gluconolactonase/LRE family protein [Acidobacteriota bacterium]
MQEWQAELAFDVRADLGEGPVWDGEQERLIWVDIMAGRIRAYRPGAGEVGSWEMGEPVGAAVLRKRGGFLAAAQSGFWTVDEATGAKVKVAEYAGACAKIRMNDGKADAQGRFWAGTMAFDMRPGAGALYRMSGGSVETMVEGVTISNGLDWTPDGRGMYYVDTMTGRVDLFDFDGETGRISRRRPFVTIEEGVGYPDGMTVDAAGNVWLALWGGWSVRCYSPAGELLGVVKVAASQTSSCAFGGKDLDELYITSARGGLSEEALSKEPSAGSLFVAKVGGKGRPCWRAD